MKNNTFFKKLTHHRLDQYAFICHIEYINILLCILVCGKFVGNFLTTTEVMYSLFYKKSGVNDRYGY